eukprot:CAMPEP_0185800610 /NCGR_PEP_ID=MMETSP1322-20130828/971_1 /TAXON_ID=265543 /ORGANISM="Minutocellus polymorphus, Strain RCC2270" /LENGTH=218 /DNA_ID=CAMNT_0028496261 /DNA_START=35 /DNA_END=691 /DNA_ORIENTATION=+
MKVSALLFAAAGFATASAIELTPDNWEAETSGKTVLIKFQALGEATVKKMKPDWDKLMEEFSGSATQLIGDVDCTADGKPLCDANGVRGYPTIKYGDPSDLQDYQGGRDLDALRKFAEENLKPVCSPANIDLCDDDKKKEIEGFMALSAADLDAKIAEEEKKLEEAEEFFKDEVQKLQDTYQKLSTEKDEKLAAVKAAGLGLMKSVKGAKAKETKDEL